MRHVRPFREKLRPLYSEIGRPSIDPEVLLRILLVGYLYGITSERRLLDEIGLNLAYRWFTGLGVDQWIADHSTFSKNRHGRFRHSSIFRDLFETIVHQCVMSDSCKVNGFQLMAGPSQQMPAARAACRASSAKVSRTLREYLAEVETTNPTPSSEDQIPMGATGKISSSDPDAKWATKGGIPPQLSYYDNYLIDNESNVILDVEATPVRFSQEVAANRTMIERAKITFAISLRSVGADKAYGSGQFLAWLLEQNIAPHIRVIDRTRRSCRFPGVT